MPLPVGGIKAPSGSINKQRKEKAAKKSSHDHSVSKQEQQTLDSATSSAIAPPLPTREQLIAADDRCYDAQHTELNVATSSHVSAVAERAVNKEPLAAEIERGEALRRLRLSFAESARKLQLNAPVGAFERWHFGWLLASARARSRSRRAPRWPIAWLAAP